MALTLYTKLVAHLPAIERHGASDQDPEQWFGQKAPILYFPGFGHYAGLPGRRSRVEQVRVEPELVRRDPRLSWEAARYQDLSGIAMSLRTNGTSEADRALVEDRLRHFLASPPPNAMEAALRCIAWLETIRFFASTGLLSRVMLRRLAMRLLQMGHYIERRLYEVPLKGNHYLTHAAGLLYLGRLLPGPPASSQWARRGYAILSREILRQFRPDGGSYEQSSAYHLFSLEVVLGATLLLSAQGAEWPEHVQERILRAAHFAGMLARPDGSIPLLGDNDSGRFHRWGPDPAVREICAISALIFNDATLARMAADASTAVSWLLGSGAPQRLATLAGIASGETKSRSFESTGLHVLLDGSNCHVAVWSRNPSPPSMVAHAHADHNSVDAWILGKHILRDPGTAIYLADTDLRNVLRGTAAHNTLTIDGCQINDFDPTDTFFMPPLTEGQLIAWLNDDACTAATVKHNGFRHLPGQPLHVRTAYLDRIARRFTIIDQVEEQHWTRRPRLVEAWWHWGDDPSRIDIDESDNVIRHRLAFAGIEIHIYLPSSSEFIPEEPFAWAPSYGVVLRGRRSVIRYKDTLPFHMVLEVAY